MREIVKTDIPLIENLLKTVLGEGHIEDIARLGGLTNHTYRVVYNGSMYAVRLPGEGTEDMIDRSDEEVSTRLACSLELDADLLYFAGNGAKVSTYIENAQTMSSELFQDEYRMYQAADVLKKLHTCNVDTKVPFDVFDMAATYEKIIKKNDVYLYDDYETVKNQVMSIKKEIDELCNPVLVPCHNDPLCENWILGGDKMYLIDWEYAGMNDGLWDVADLSIEAGFDEAKDELFLERYFNSDALDVQQMKHFIANKIYVDYLWTLWAKTRVPFDGQPMEDWATERYIRFKENIERYHSFN